MRYAGTALLICGAICDAKFWFARRPPAPCRVIVTDPGGPCNGSGPVAWLVVSVVFIALGGIVLAASRRRSQHPS